MALEYTNSIGKTYRLLKTITKKGTPKYFFSAKPDSKGEPQEKIPEGFEIYEHPAHAQAYLRKKRPKLITDEEREFVTARVEKLKRDQRYRVDCKDGDITIYESDTNITAVENIIGNLLKQFPPPGDGKRSIPSADEVANTINSHYTAVLRFHLEDREKRLFVAERFCFRGSVDDWIFIEGPDSLQKLVKTCVPTLGTNEFFDRSGFF